MVTFFVVLTILINEVMPAPSNAPEWVELYNPGPDAVDISGWYIDDDTFGGTQMLIPADTIIEPTSLYVITLNSAIFNNTGDAVTLYDADGQLIDRIDFGSMKSTESISRIPDGGDIISKAPPSPGQFNAPAASTTVTHTTTPIIESTTTSVVDPQLTVTPSEAYTTEPTQTPSATHTPSPSVTESHTRTPSPSVTESHTHTPSPTKTPSHTRTPSPTKTPSHTRTPSMSKTPSHTLQMSFTRTPSLTRTPSPTKTPSRTRTPSMSKTPRPSRTSKSTLTPRASKTPRLTRTSDVTSAQEQHRSSESPVSTPILAIHGRATTPQLVVCPPDPSTLDRWSLSATGHHIALPDSTECVTVELPPDPPAMWNLTNPHGLIVATIDVFAQYCAHDVSDCQPSPTMINLAIHIDYQRSSAPTIRVTSTPYSVALGDDSTAHLPSQVPTTSAPSTIPLGMLLMLGGWIALKLLARPTDDVLYSEADEDAASSDDSLSSESRKV